MLCWKSRIAQNKNKKLANKVLKLKLNAYPQMHNNWQNNLKLSLLYFEYSCLKIMTMMTMMLEQYIDGYYIRMPLKIIYVHSYVVTFAWMNWSSSLFNPSTKWPQLWLAVLRASVPLSAWREHSVPKQRNPASGSIYVNYTCRKMSEYSNSSLIINIKLHLLFKWGGCVPIHLV